MKSPNPLIPQGSHQNLERGKSNVKVFVFTILAIHVVLLGGLLNQGCKPPQEGDQASLGGPTIEEFPPLRTDFGSPARSDGPGESGFYDAPPPVNGFVDDEPVRLLDNTPRNNPPPPANGGGPGPAVVPRRDDNPGASNNVPDTPTTPPTALVTTPEPAPAREEVIEHTVVRDDNFTKIAKAYNVGVQDVVAANPQIDPRKLQIGMKVKVPKSPARSATAANAPPAVSGKTYTVKRDDTLTGIARSQGTTIAALKEANNLSSDRILVGQELVIPGN